MEVELALFQHDDLLCRAAIRIEKLERSEEFDYGLADSIPTGHLVVRHQFGLPAASLAVTLVRYAPESAPEIVLQMAIQMGVHDSEDWVRIPRMQLVALERLASRERLTVGMVLTRELRDLVSVHSEWLSVEVPGFAEALAWPEG